MQRPIWTSSIINSYQQTTFVGFKTQFFTEPNFNYLFVRKRRDVYVAMPRHFLKALSYMSF